MATTTSVGESSTNATIVLAIQEIQRVVAQSDGRLNLMDQRQTDMTRGLTVLQESVSVLSAARQQVHSEVQGPRSSDRRPIFAYKDMAPGVFGKGDAAGAWKKWATTMLGCIRQQCPGAAEAMKAHAHENRHVT